MIGKLMKYELRSVLRKFLPLWAGLAALGLLNGFTIRLVLANDRLEGLSNFLLGVLPLLLLIMLGTVLWVLTLVFICQRFYQGLLGREGYLMFTLPVSSAEHILAKALSALLLAVLTALVFFVSGALLVLALDFRDMFAVFSELEPLELPQGFGWLLTEGVLYALVTAVTAVLHIYTAVALGHLAPKHRLAWAVAAYVGINMFLSTGVYRIGALIARMPSLELFFDESGFHGSLAPVAGFLGWMILLNLALCAAYFFATKLILDRKLNLE